MNLDWKDISTGLWWAFTGLLTFFGGFLWQDVQKLKSSWITREEFNAKHGENTGNFRRVEDRLQASDERQHAESMAVERRLGEVLTRIAELRPRPREDGPERRQGY